VRLAKLSCATGSLNIEGSSAFAPIIGNIAGEYTRLCHGAAITAQSTGSINGVRSLGTLALAGKDKLAVLSDGTDPQASADLVPQAVAVIVYSIVVNRTTGVEN
jgi:ABC-type phosphate transport system substrate-binding protein